MLQKLQIGLVRLGYEVGCGKLADSSLQTMKLEELENRDKIVTNDFLRAEIEIVRKEMALLKADLMKAVVQSRHSQRTMILGIYVLIVIGIFASHVWR